MQGYCDLLTSEGMVLEHVEACRDVAEGFPIGISKRLVMSEIASGPDKLSISAGLLSEGKRLLAKARDLLSPASLATA